MIVERETLVARLAAQTQRLLEPGRALADDRALGDAEAVREAAVAWMCSRACGATDAAVVRPALVAPVAVAIARLDGAIHAVHEAMRTGAMHAGELVRPITTGRVMGRSPAPSAAARERRAAERRALARQLASRPALRLAPDAGPSEAP